MSDLARRITLLGEVERRAEGDPLLKAPGDLVLVRRGPLRSALIRCPDGCGDTLCINLDPRSGKAWRLRHDGRNATLYPSVWRDDGCGSHFVVWRDRILWCDPGDARDNVEPPYDASSEARLAATLTPGLRHVTDMAEQVGLDEWEVGRTCRRLVDRGMARDGGKDRRDWFGTA